jgi:hypothetical protein
MIATAAAAAAATILTFASAQADESTVGYNVAPGACSKPIAIPANNKPVVIAGTSIVSDDPGTGQVTLLRNTNANPHYLLWSGADFFAGAEKGSTSAASTLIMYLDVSGKIAVLSAASSSLTVCASVSFSEHAVGYLTFID